jgi:WD40 repeat protein
MNSLLTHEYLATQTSTVKSTTLSIYANPGPEKLAHFTLPAPSSALASLLVPSSTSSKKSGKQNSVSHKQAFAVAGAAGVINVYSVATAKLAFTLESGEAAQVVDLAASGSLLYSASSDGFVSVWDLKTRLLKRYEPINLIVLVNSRHMKRI